MSGRDGRDRFRRRDLTVGTGFDGRTGRYGQVLTGRDGRGRFCRRDGTAGAGLVDGMVRGYFRDGTGRCSAAGDIFSTGRDGTGCDGQPDELPGHHC